jgi:hypothetical protein
MLFMATTFTLNLAIILMGLILVHLPVPQQYL